MILGRFSRRFSASGLTITLKNSIVAATQRGNVPSRFYLGKEAMLNPIIDLRAPHRPTRPVDTVSWSFEAKKPVQLEPEPEISISEVSEFYEFLDVPQHFWQLRRVVIAIVIIILALLVWGIILATSAHAKPLSRPNTSPKVVVPHIPVAQATPAASKLDAQPQSVPTAQHSMAVSATPTAAPPPTTPSPTPTPDPGTGQTRAGLPGDPGTSGNPIKKF